MIESTVIYSMKPTDDGEVFEKDEFVDYNGKKIREVNSEKIKQKLYGGEQWKIPIMMKETRTI